MGGTIQSSMRINRLTLQNFRNYREQEVSFSSGCNVISGENAAGKTNLLEAVVYLSCGKAPRARSERELIRFGEAAAGLKGRINARERDFLVEAEIPIGKRRKLSINGVPVKTAAALSEVYNTVYFCPEDLSLIRDGAAARRRFLDTALCQLRPRYAAVLSEYGRVYEHKTRILRDWEEKPDLLNALPDFNERLVQCGAVLIRYRAQFAEKLKEYAAESHRDCSGGKEELALCYETVSSVTDPLASAEAIAEQLRRHMEEHRKAELSSRLCLSGPHKDDLVLSIGGREARTYSSQGQTRTAALALKLAEREIYKNAAGEYPVLLLDDVLSELDPKRQDFVLSRIPGGQVLITCCEEDRLPCLPDARLLRVEGGRVLE